MTSENTKKCTTDDHRANEYLANDQRANDRGANDHGVDEHGANRHHDTAHGHARPLGFWLRVVDARITREFATALHAEGVGRREWMLLNVLAREAGVPSDSPWLTRREGRPSRPLRSLIERGWAAANADGTWSLTAEGSATRERLAGSVNNIREQVAAAISHEAYATTMASLEAIARALGREEPGDVDAAGAAHGRDGRYGRRRWHGGEPGTGHGRGRGHGHGHGHGCGRGRGHRNGHSYGREGGHERGGFHAHRHAARHAQRAFERGFERGHESGFSRGRRAGDA